MRRALAAIAIFGASCASAERTDWWSDARYGMFIHWGAYSVPAGRHAGRTWPGASEWLMHTAQIPIAEYERFVPQFNPVEFDARAWARLARAAGMRYVVITSKHHDGFSMFDTHAGAYDIVDATEFGRDPLVELAAACRAEGLRFGVYYSILDWHEPGQRGHGKAAYVERMKAQLRELVDRLHPDILWFDGEWEDWWTEADADDLQRFVRGIAPHAVVNNRVGKRRRTDGDFETPEQEIPAAGIPGRLWETCMTLNDSWGFKADDHNWKSPRGVLARLVECASKGGNFLLNVGPTAQGVIPAESAAILEEVGRWLDAHGEAIYGTEGFCATEWGGLTRRGSRVYAIIVDRPDGPVRIPLIGRVVRSSLPLESRGDDGYELIAPATDELATVVTIDMADEPRRALTRAERTALGEPIPAAPDGAFELWAADAALRGGEVRVERVHPRGNVGYWTAPGDWVEWFVDSPGGTYALELTLAVAPGAGGEFEVRAGETAVASTCSSTGSWGSFTTASLGRLRLPPGRQSISVRPVSFNHALMNLATLRLSPTGDPPPPCGPVPTDAQRAWQDLEIIGIVPDSEDPVLYLDSRLRGLILVTDSRMLLQRFIGLCRMGAVRPGVACPPDADLESLLSVEDLLEVRVADPSQVDIARRLQPGAIHSGWSGPDVRWIGNDRGVAPIEHWNTLDPARAVDIRDLRHGRLDGGAWVPASADTHVRASVEEMLSIHDLSVGRGATLSLVMRSPEDAGIVRAFREALDATFRADLAVGASATASDERGSDFSGAAACDGSRVTCWVPRDGVTSATLELTLERSQRFDRVVIREAIEFGQRVTEWAVEVGDGDAWRKIAAGTTIGRRRDARFAPVSASRVRLTILGARACPAIASFELYRSPAVARAPVVRRQQDAIVIETGGARVRYTTDGSEPTRESPLYVSPFAAERGAVVTAAVLPEDNAAMLFPRGPIVVRARLPLDPSGWRVVRADCEETSGENGAARNAIDGNPGTHWHTTWTAGSPPHPHEIVVDLGAETAIGAIGVLPRSDGGVNGAIRGFEIYVGGDAETWDAPAATGEFTAAGEPTVEFPAGTRGRYVRIVARSEVNGNPWTSIAEIRVYE